jgi:CheY-like chemotaxis protein
LLSGEGCVLVVDDDENIRDTLRDVVEMAGCSAIVARNGVEALEVLARHQPCLIILDLLMPVMGGEQMLEEMKKEPAIASLPVVISTSAPERAPRGIPVVPKPIDIEALWEIMRRTCHCAANHVPGRA